MQISFFIALEKVNLKSTKLYLNVEWFFQRDQVKYKFLK